MNPNKEILEKFQEKLEKNVEYFLNEGLYEEAEKYQEVIDKNKKVLKKIEEEEKECQKIIKNIS